MRSSRTSIKRKLSYYNFFFGERRGKPCIAGLFFCRTRCGSFSDLLNGCNRRGSPKESFGPLMIGLHFIVISHAQNDGYKKEKRAKKQSTTTRIQHSASFGASSDRLSLTILCGFRNWIYIPHPVSKNISRAPSHHLLFVRTHCLMSKKLHSRRWHHSCHASSIVYF